MPGQIELLIVSKNSSAKTASLSTKLKNNQLGQRELLRIYKDYLDYGETIHTLIETQHLGPALIKKIAKNYIYDNCFFTNREINSILKYLILNNLLSLSMLELAYIEKLPKLTNEIYNLIFKTQDTDFKTEFCQLYFKQLPILLCATQYLTTDSQQLQSLLAKRLETTNEFQNIPKNLKFVNLADNQYQVKCKIAAQLIKNKQKSVTIA